MFQPQSLPRTLRGDAARRRRRHVHRCRRRTTSSRSTRRPAASSGSTRYTPSPQARPCCGRVNRGLAILGDTLFMGTHRRASGRARREERHAGLERHARSRGPKPATRSPSRRSSSRTRSSSASAAASTASADSSPPIDAKTGKEAWRFYTIPGPGEPGHETWARRLVEARRRLGLGHRLLRSGAEPDVLGHRQSRSRLERRQPRGRQPLHRLASSRSTPTPAS